MFHRFITHRTCIWETCVIRIINLGNICTLSDICHFEFFVYLHVSPSAKDRNYKIYELFNYLNSDISSNFNVIFV